MHHSREPQKKERDQINNSSVVNSRDQSTCKTSKVDQRSRMDCSRESVNKKEVKKQSRADQNSLDWRENQQSSINHANRSICNKCECNICKRIN